MAKYRSGLHKEISSIFDGVPLPNKDDPKQGSSVPSKVKAGYVPPIPPVSVPQQQTQEIRPQNPKPQVEENFPETESVPAKVFREPEITENYKPKREMALKQIFEKIRERVFAKGDSDGSSKQKVMVLLIPILAIAMIFMMIRAFSTPKTNAAVNIVPSGNKTAENQLPKTEWQIAEIYPSTLRDPMQFATVASKNSNGELVVAGILYSEDKASAVINGRIVYQGDEILGAKVTKIENKSVEFEMDGKTWTQKVQE